MIRLTASNPILAEQWRAWLAATGVTVSPFALNDSTPIESSSRIWMVVLDRCTPPSQVGFWLRHHPIPKILVTDHVRAAQHLVPSDPHIVLISTPSCALASLTDIFTLAPWIASGTIVLANREPDRSMRRRGKGETYGVA